MQLLVGVVCGSGLGQRCNAACVAVNVLYFGSRLKYQVGYIVRSTGFLVGSTSSVVGTGLRCIICA